MPVRKLTSWELQLKIEALKVAMNRAKIEGHPAIASECQKVINAYRHRIVAAQKRDDAGECGTATMLRDTK